MISYARKIVSSLRQLVLRAERRQVVRTDHFRDRYLFLNHRGREWKARVIDSNERGFGVETSTAVSPLATVVFEGMARKKGPRSTTLRGRADVVYCQRLGSSFRAGLEINEVGFVRLHHRRPSFPRLRGLRAMASEGPAQGTLKRQPRGWSRWAGWRGPKRAPGELNHSSKQPLSAFLRALLASARVCPPTRGALAGASPRLADALKQRSILGIDTS